MTEKRHWNNLTKNYTEEIFDVFANDKKKLLAASFKNTVIKKVWPYILDGATVKPFST